MTTTTLPSIDFADFYRALFDREPYPWQERIAAQIFLGESVSWPASFDLPTGTGKTTLVWIALWSLLVRSDAPRRIVYVVNRRILVNDVHDKATAIIERIKDAKDGPLHEASKALRARYGTDDLPVLLLRGGTGERLANLESATVPAIIVSTIDQVGSRLLFRGYGVRVQRAPIWAGLLSHDALWLLDEAHVSQPFLRTLRRIAAMTAEAGTRTGLARRMWVVAMSATVPTEGGERFSLDGTDRDHLKKIINASKPARIVQAKQYRDLKSRIEEGVEEAIAAGCRRILVVANRVRTARDVHAILAKNTDWDCDLLIGLNRPVEAERLAKDSGAFATLQAESRSMPTRPTILVATQTVEIGVDLDADALVTEAASLDALIQRFGRLNRRGEWTTTFALIVHNVEKSDADPIYGNAIPATMAFLKKNCLEKSKGRGAKADEIVDFGVTTMANRLQALDDDGRRAVFGIALQHEPITPEVAERFAQTYPRLRNGPEPAAFLHGQAVEREVNLIWRDGIKRACAKGDRSGECIAPPTAREILALPIAKAKAWIEGRVSDAAHVGDVPSPEHYLAGAQRHTREPSLLFPLLLWNEADESWEKIDDAEQLRKAGGIRADATLAVDADCGGADAFGWHPSSKQRTRDVFEAASLLRRKDGTLLGFDLVLDRRFDDVDDVPDDVLIATWEIDRRMNGEDDPDETTTIIAGCEEWKTTGSFDVRMIEDGDGVRVVGISWEADRQARESGAGTWAGPNVIDLRTHSLGVARTVEEVARELGLPDDVIDVLKTAGLLHDLGKADHRVQAENFGTPVTGKINAEDFVAKSPLMKNARRRDWAKGLRHEANSLRMIDGQGDLVRHLVVTHHGYARPGFPMVRDEGRRPITVVLEGKTYHTPADRPAAQAIHESWYRDFDRLNDEWGPWGLAYLEAILRLADWHCSKEEQGR